MRYPNYTGSEPCAQVGLMFFYPPENEMRGFSQPVNYTHSRMICSDCWIKVECAEWAIHHERYGFWGGLSPEDRAEVRKRRNIMVELPEHVVERGVDRASA